jgi:hypothetical protein
MFLANGTYIKATSEGFKNPTPPEATKVELKTAKYDQLKSSMKQGKNVKLRLCQDAKDPKTKKSKCMEFLVNINDTAVVTKASEAKK